MIETCNLCGKRLSKKAQKLADRVDRFLTITLEDRKIGPMAWCSACLRKYDRKPDDWVPDGFGIKEWRETLAIFSAYSLGRFLQSEELAEMIEPLLLSQLVFLNLLNTVGERALKAALRKARQRADVILEVTTQA